MKIRTGFVSNSSSSSFVCDFCGNDVSGWDMCLSDAEMFQCENSHTVCLRHLSEEEQGRINQPFKTKEEFIQKLNELKADKLLTEITDDNWEDVVNESYMGNFTDGPNYDIPETLCPLCQFKDMTSDDMSAYLLKTLGQTKMEMVETIKTKFKLYTEFKKYLKGE
jgi:hypothetical protein